MAAFVMVVVFLLPLSGCVPRPAPTDTPTTGPTGSALDPDAVFRGLDEDVANRGGQGLGHYVASPTASVSLVMPDGLTQVGVVVACFGPESYAEWRVTFGNDDSRWVGGRCSGAIAHTSALFQVHDEEQGRIDAVVRAPDGHSSVFVAFFASQ